MRFHALTGFAAVVVAVMLAPRDVASAPPTGPGIAPALLRSRVPLSIGAPNAGRLLRGVKLEASDQVRIVPAWNQPDYRWGLPRLVGMVERAAQYVDGRHGPSKLSVGDISSRWGGALRKHKSHQSGRDVDIGFYIKNRRGEPIYHHSFVEFDAQGRSRALPDAQFDDARNWTLIEALLNDRQTRVQWIFVSDELRHRLLVEAERRGVSRSMLQRGARVMMQPKGSIVHVDHFHVRISCPTNQRGICEQHPRRPSTQVQTQSSTSQSSTSQSSTSQSSTSQSSTSKIATVRRGKRRRSGS